MPEKPAAEVSIDARLIRGLLAAQAAAAIPDATSLPLEKVAEGWDSEVWRLGDQCAVRLPRRALAASLVLNEQSVLPGIADRLGPIGVRVPVPIVDGVAGGGFPWAWSVVPWIDGVAALDQSPSERGVWAPTLARALMALHTKAPAAHPVNPFRGVPLASRTDAVEDRLRTLRATGVLDASSADVVHALWQAGLVAPAWDRTPVWIHGDLHPGNLVAHDGTLAGIIDFGDVTAGDPAYDLAVAWLAFDTAGRDAFIAATGLHYDAGTWVRARAWAAAVVLMLLAHSDDNPAYFALGRDAAAEVLTKA